MHHLFYIKIKEYRVKLIMNLQAVLIMDNNIENNSHAYSDRRNY